MTAKISFNGIATKHTLHKDYGSYKVKDIKLSIRHQSWLVDSKLSLETVLEFVY